VAAIRLLIVDNHTLFRQGLVSLLQSEPGYEVTGEASSGEEALHLVPELGPDVVLMDIKMPGIGGVEATHRLMEANPEARVLMLTVSEEEENLFAAIQAGARGYILAGESPPPCPTCL
jgi:DNA-binding NarL/FixJ family response regulator